MNWGQWSKSFNTKEIASMIVTCINHDITTFDHADIYGSYTTESDFGTAFKHSGISRQKLQLISKCGIAHVSPNRPHNLKHYNYRKRYIITSVETSLKNLKTDYLDALLLHRPSPLMNPHEVMEAVAKLGQEGKIKAFGVSNPATIPHVGTNSGTCSPECGRSMARPRTGHSMPESSTAKDQSSGSTSVKEDGPKTTYQSGVRMPSRQQPQRTPE